MFIRGLALFSGTIHPKCGVLVTVPITCGVFRQTIFQADGCNPTLKVGLHDSLLADHVWIFGGQTQCIFEYRGTAFEDATICKSEGGGDGLIFWGAQKRSVPPVV